MKKSILSLFFSASVIIAAAQPDCFIGGLAYNTGKTNITNYGFSRTAGVTSDGAPVYTFGDYISAKNNSNGAGLVVDSYTKHWRIATDLMVPLKNSQTNFFNLNIAYGGYIKEKFGVLFGLSGYANSKKYSVLPTDVNYKPLLLTDTVKTSGLYYSNAAPGSLVGANMLLTYALAENIVFRVEIGKYIATTESKKTPYADNFEFKRKGSTKIEFGAVWQISDKFGLFLRYNMWTTKGFVNAKNIKYTSLTNPSAGGLTTDLQVIPEQTFKSNNLTFGVMIPFGGAESQRTVISAKTVN